MTTCYTYPHPVGLTREDFQHSERVEKIEDFRYPERVMEIFKEAGGFIGFRIWYYQVMEEDPDPGVLVTLITESERRYRRTLEFWLTKLIDTIFSLEFLAISLGIILVLLLG